MFGHKASMGVSGGGMQYYNTEETGEYEEYRGGNMQSSNEGNAFNSGNMNEMMNMTSN